MKIALATLSLLMLACGPSRPQAPMPPEPVPPVVEQPVPSLPTTDPLTMRGDFRAFWCGPEFYIIGDQEFPRSECLDDYLAHGYTDVWVTVTRDGGLPGIAPFDYLADVPRFRAITERFRSRGLRVHPVIGCEDAREMCRRNHGDFPAWLDRVAAFVAGVDDVVTSYVLGVELREWATWDQGHDLIERVAAASDRPILPHFNQGRWGPSSADPWGGGSQLAWWRQALEVAGNNPLAAALQYEHARVEDTGGGFLSAVEEVDRFTRAVVDRLRPLGIAVIGSEWAYRVPEVDAIERGRAALHAGAVGCMNGCPR